MNNPTPLKLKIQLQDAPHKIIRKVLVPEDIRMSDFHRVIQYAMGWENAHLFEFSDKERLSRIRVGASNEFDTPFFDREIRDADKVYLKEVFLTENGGKPFFYTYDFGDSWLHKISFQKVSKKQSAAFKGYPVCIDAQGKCPPEDIGGVWGYMHFLEVIKDKKNPENKEMRDWFGIDPDQQYDETTADINAINQGLKMLS